MKWFKPSKTQAQTETTKEEVDASRKAAKAIMDAQFQSLFDLMQETLISVSSNSEELNSKNAKGKDQ